MMLKIWMPFLFMLISTKAFGYIPDYKMIMSRVAENHGHGYYKIVQDVIFPTEEEPLVVTETWIIKDQDSMRVSLAGKGPLKDLIQGTIIYDKSDRIYLDESGKQRRSSVGQDWAEPFFHFRFSKNIKPRMVGLKMAPPSSLEPRKFDEENPLLYEPQHFLRLSRVGGVVAYAIGTPTPEDGDNPPPGLWVEQDRFHVLKVRMPSEAIVRAEDYARHSRKFWLPKERKYKWAAYEVETQVGQVSALPYTSAIKKLLTSSSLKSNGKSSRNLKIPNTDIMVEFYTRFR